MKNVLRFKFWDKMIFRTMLIKIFKVKIIISVENLEQKRTEDKLYVKTMGVFTAANNLNLH